MLVAEDCLEVIQRKGILEDGAGFLPTPVLLLLSVIRETLDNGKQ